MNDSLAAIHTGAEPITAPIRLELATGETVSFNPATDSLDQLEATIRDAARRMGPIDGRTIFTVAARQLGDVAATRKAGAR